MPAFYPCADEDRGSTLVTCPRLEAEGGMGTRIWGFRVPDVMKGCRNLGSTLLESSGLDTRLGLGAKGRGSGSGGWGFWFRIKRLSSAVLNPWIVCLEFGSSSLEIGN